MSCPWTSTADCWVENVNSSSLADQQWDSCLVNKKVSSGVLKFSRSKKFHRGVNSLPREEAHPLWAQRQGGAGEGQAWTLSLMETSKNWRFSSWEQAEEVLFSSCVSLRRSCPTWWVDIPEQRRSFQSRAIFISKAAFPLWSPNESSWLCAPQLLLKQHLSPNRKKPERM